MSIVEAQTRSSAATQGDAAAGHQQQVCEALRHHAAQGELSLTLSGNCMAPYLHDGQKVTIRAKQRYWPGDLIIVQNLDGRLLCHRLLGWYRRGGRTRWLTQADIARRPDHAVLGNQVIGAPACSYSGHFHRAGYWSRVTAGWHYLRWAMVAARRRLPGKRAGTA